VQALGPRLWFKPVAREMDVFVASSGDLQLTLSRQESGLWESYVHPHDIWLGDFPTLAEAKAAAEAHATAAWWAAGGGE
jgi:hypothetical protein